MIVIAAAMTTSTNKAFRRTLRLNHAGSLTAPLTERLNSWRNLFGKRKGEGDATGTHVRRGVPGV
jgi:hypothetical protein